MQVSLSDILVSLFEVHIFKPSNQENALALTQMNWLHNESFIVLLFIELLAEIIHLLRKDPCLREEVKFIWKDFSHSH